MKRITTLIIASLLISSTGLSAVERTGTAGLITEGVEKELKVGASVTLRVYVEDSLDKDAGWHITENSVNGWLDLGTLLVQPQAMAVTVEGNGTTRFDLPAVLMRPGTGDLKNFTIENEARTVVIHAKGKIAEIGSLLSEEEKKSQPMWVLPPVDYGGWNYWLIGVAALLASILILYLGYLLFRRLRRPTLNALSYFEQAKHELQKLEPLIKHTDRASQRRIGYALAKILREFSQQRFGISATEMTDQEFIRALERINAMRAKIPEIKCTFENLDLLRYSAATAAPTVAPKLLVDVRTFVAQNPPPMEADKK